MLQNTVSRIDTGKRFFCLVSSSLHGITSTRPGNESLPLFPAGPPLGTGRLHRLPRAFCSPGRTASALSLSSLQSCSVPQTGFGSLLWTRSSRSTSFSDWRLQGWTQRSRWGLMGAERRGRITSLACWPCSFCCSLGYGWPSGLWAHTVAHVHLSPKSFTLLLSVQWLSSLCLCLGLSWPTSRPLHLALFDHSLDWSTLSGFSTSSVPLVFC